MQLITNRLGSRPLPPSAVALGSFDGLHGGHMALIRQTQKTAREKGLVSGIYTFDRHPSCFKSNDPVKLITPLPLKLALLEDAGIDFVYIEHVTEDFFNISPVDFVDHILRGQCNAKFVAAGFNFHFGKNRSGTPDYLQTLCAQRNMDCLIQSPVTESGEPISSSRIRDMIASGDLSAAAHCLGHFFEVRGLVAHGHQRGRKLLGFPTANLYPSPILLLPPNGVYLTFSTIEGRRYPSITNVGLVPTFAQKRISIETHLLEFDGDLYGKQMRVEFLRPIRFEQKFSGPDALRLQIQADIETAWSIIRKERLQ